MLRGRDREWYLQATCRESESNDAVSGGMDSQRVFANYYCRECPVKQQCVADVLTPDGELDTYWPGVRGGITEMGLRDMFPIAPQTVTSGSHKWRKSYRATA